MIVSRWAEDAPRHDEWFADAPRPEGVPEPTDDVPYRWSRAAWNAALRVVSQPLTYDALYAEAIRVCDTVMGVGVPKNFTGTIRSALYEIAEWARSFAVSQPTREQIAEAIKSAKRGPDDWYLDVADAVLALFGKSEAKLFEHECPHCHNKRRFTDADEANDWVTRCSSNPKNQ